MITIESIKYQGVLDKERVIFNITEDGNIGKQLVFCAKSILKKDGTRQLQNFIYEAYWFIDKDVRSGDLAVLYTKDPGLNYKVKENANGSKTHFFYWRKDEPLWSRENVSLVVGRIGEWYAQHIEYNDIDIEP